MQYNNIISTVDIYTNIFEQHTTVDREIFVVTIFS